MNWYFSVKEKLPAARLDMSHGPNSQLRARYIAVSAAKSLTIDLACSGRSLIYTRKRIGPRTEPYGTPEETGIQFEFTPFMTTACFLLSKKSLIHFRASPLIPW